MALTRLPSSTTEQLDLTINNGDFAALKETANRLGFKDEESMLRFTLAVLSKSATRSLTITNQNGETISLSPSDTLVKSEK